MHGHFSNDDLDRRDLAYELDDWELYSWRQFLRQLGRYDDASELRQWDGRRPEWSLLGRELFGRLLTRDDLMEADDPLDWATTVHDEASGLAEWRTLVELCAGHRYDAGVAALAVVSELHDQFDGQLPNGGEGGDGQGDGDEEGDGQGGQGEQEGDAGEGIRDALRRACAKAQQDTTERRDAMRTMGVGWGNETGQHGRDSTQQRQAIEVAKRLRKDRAFSSLANLAGRMRTSIRAKRAARLKGKPAEISDVILGNNPARMLPTEMAKLRRRPLRLDLLRRLTERQVAQYEVTGREVAERGPMVVAVDFSGSMSGDNLVWAKAVALALASVARDQRRPYLALAFDTQILDRYEDTQGLEPLFAFVNRSSAGGTDWDVPLEEAQRVIQDPKTRRFEQADIVLITDGECGSNDRWRTNWERWRLDTGVHCYGIHIDDHGGRGYSRTDGALAGITDEVFPIRINGQARGGGIDGATDAILQRFAEVL